MKKAMIGMLTLAFLFGVSALAEMYTIDQPDSYETYACMDFKTELPDEIAEIFDEVLRKGDRILSGSKVTERMKQTDIVNLESVLMAVEREGRIVIMCACRKEGDWETCVETDSFFSPGTEFEITYLPAEGGEGWGIDAHYAMVCGDEIWRIKVWPGCFAELVSYEKRSPDGTRLVTHMLYSTISAFTLRDGVRQEQEEVHCCSLPSRLSAWAMEDVPKDLSQVQRYAQTHQPVLGEHQAYISCNLRERPTGKSRSFGVYSARVDVLGSQMGTREPWYHVRVGDTEGWVTASYLIDGSRHDIRFYSMGAMTLPPARADQEVELRKTQGGETFARLMPGAVMHVIARNEGWLHVVIPKDGVITPKANWDGVYGYVREDEVVLGDTLADLRWK